jgi:hypothetical protein
MAGRLCIYRVLPSRGWPGGKYCRPPEFAARMAEISGNLRKIGGATIFFADFLTKLYSA